MSQDQDQAITAVIITGEGVPHVYTGDYIRCDSPHIPKEVANFYVTYQGQIDDSSVFIPWIYEPGGEPWPFPNWEEAFAWLSSKVATARRFKSSYLAYYRAVPETQQLSREAFVSMIRECWPEKAKAWDANFLA